MTDRSDFRSALVIPNTGGRTLGECLEPWQVRNIIAPLDALDASGQPLYRRLYFGLARGHGKSVIAACECLTTLVLEDDVQIYLIGPNAQQVAEVQLRFLQNIIRDTPGLAGLEVFRDKITCRDSGSEIKVVSSELGSALGLGGHGGYTAVMDESWAYPEQFRPLYEQLIESRIKAAGRWKIITTTNAGWDESSICWGEREICRKDKTYWFYEPSGFIAKFPDREQVKKLRAELPEHEAARALDNQWRSPADITITADMVRAVTSPGLAAVARRQEHTSYLLALDLAYSADKTALVAAHVEFRPAGGAEPVPPPQDTPAKDPLWDAWSAACTAYEALPQQPVVVVDAIETRQGTAGTPVQIDDIIALIHDLQDRFAPQDVLYDPSVGARGLLTHLGNHAHPLTPTQSLRGQLGSALYYAIKDKRVALYHDGALQRELVNLRFRATQYGLEFSNRKGEHDDISVCLAMIIYFVTSSGVWKPRANLSFGSIGGRR